MRIFTGPVVPTPFGKVSLPNLETPPMRMPSRPDGRTRKVVAQGLGEDLAGVFGIIPWIGDIIGDVIEDVHAVEIRKLLSSEEFSVFLENNKGLPTTLALIRTLSFPKF
mgnify:FL=1